MNPRNGAHPGDAAFVIAEAGVNHNGSLELALELVDAAAGAGADAVKLQTFRSERLVSARAPKARYQVETTGGAESQLEMVRRLELGEDAHRAVAERCGERGVRFLSTPFDHESLALLVRLGVDPIKIGSGDLTNGPLLHAAASTGRSIILSTGMADLGDVEAALAALAAGYLAAGGAEVRPSAQAFEQGRALLLERVTLLHCTTEYPAPAAEVNLRAMATLASSFGLRVGYSDHTEGILVPVLAVGLGAVVIEKHLTLDRTMPGPDHRASLEPTAFAEMVAGIRLAEAALGDGRKIATPSELRNVEAARRSLVASRPIRRGEPLSADNLAAKRPGNGVSPMRFWDYLGRPAARDYEIDEEIDP